MEMTEFAKGFWVGVFMYPAYTLVRITLIILTNAWTATYKPSACTGDCNQGRNCTCKDTV